MKLFIADDNVGFRTRLAAVLGGIPGIEVSGVSGDVAGTIEGVRKAEPDTLILDIRMPGGSGMDALSAVKKFRKAPVVIMLTIGPRSEYQAVCLANGADYFFEKSSELQRMVSLLTTMAAKSPVRGAVHYSRKAHR